MKKIFILLTSTMLLTGCAETIALLGPASSLVGGGNVVQSTVSSAVNYGVKKTTGKSPMQHALAYAEEKNPNKIKDRCVSFVKQTESEACYIAKKQISSVKKSASRKIKNVIAHSKNKVAKKIKAEEKVLLQVETKKAADRKIKGKMQTVKKIKTEQELKLKSIENMLVESTLSKKHISHLRVSIGKNSRIKD
jgi:uncharacterized protein YcfL